MWRSLQLLDSMPCLRESQFDLAVVGTQPDTAVPWAGSQLHLFPEAIVCANGRIVRHSRQAATDAAETPSEKTNACCAKIILQFEEKGSTVDENVSGTASGQRAQEVRPPICNGRSSLSPGC